MKKATLIATLAAPPSAEGTELSALPDTVGWLEVRSDLLGDLDPDWLRSRFRGRLLYALRSSAEGGDFAGPLRQRHERLMKAARGYDLVELEAERDSTADVLAEIPAHKRLLSWHGDDCDLPSLKNRFGRLAACPAALYRLVTKAAKGSGELAVLSLLRSLGRADTLAYSTGPLGFWTRLVAPHLGAPVVIGSVPDGRSAPAEPSINRLIEDYGLPLLAPLEGLYGIVGNPVFHSLSPRLHNAAYRALDHPALFVPFQVDSFTEFWHEVVRGGVLESVGVPIKGLTVASPHKETALATAMTASRMARRAESANILVQDDGAWKADTTDPEVVFTAQREHGVQTERKRAAVIGCGGAGRAIAAALDLNGAGVTMVNRGAERGRYAARLLDLPYTPLSTFSAGGFDLVVNATPVGRDDGEVPFDLETLGAEGVVIDLVYGSAPTPLVAGAGRNGRVVIDGREVLLAQVLRQFRMMTGREMPESLAREKLGLAVEASDLVAAG
ncbi:MAG TPA: type I 3-dehydroquinate dehydratase [Pyrinomonadaceae bacterium]|nr:type I 3-dehydroquinate dehydratase [Pyrinomonadaceae bacterium]